MLRRNDFVARLRRGPSAANTMAPQSIDGPHTMPDASAPPKKVILAYSGGLDTSIILKWLQVEYGCEVVTFTADLGQGEELEPARQKALDAGV